MAGAVRAAAERLRGIGPSAGARARRCGGGLGGGAVAPPSSVCRRGSAPATMPLHVHGSHGLEPAGRRPNATHGQVCCHASG